MLKLDTCKSTGTVSRDYFLMSLTHTFAIRAVLQPDRTNICNFPFEITALDLRTRPINEPFYSKLNFEIVSCLIY